MGFAFWMWMHECINGFGLMGAGKHFQAITNKCDLLSAFEDPECK